MNTKNLTKYILFFILLGLFFAGCDFTSEQRHKNPYYITGLLFEGETVTQENPIMFGKTISMENGNLFGFYIEDAVVTLKDSSSSTIINLTWNEQAMSFDQFGYYDESDSLVIQAGHTYEIKATFENEDGESIIVTAKTKVPEQLSVLPNEGFSFNDEEPYPTMIYDDIDSSYPIKCKMNETNEFYYTYWEVFCLEAYNQAEYIRPFDDDYPEDQEDYEDPLTGSPRREDDVQEYSSDNDGILTRDGYSMFFTFYGKHRIKVYSIDDNFYNYKTKEYSADKYFFGGINNGVGYFGSVSGTEIYTDIIE